MKFFIVALALIAAASADVSHLNNEYLPPVQPGGSFASHSSSAEYAQQADEVPQAIGADSYTPEHLQEQAPVEEQHQDVPLPIGADSYTPAHLAEQEPQQEQPAYEEFNPDTHIPAVVYGNAQADEAAPAPTVEEFKPETHIPTVVYGDVPAQQAPAQYEAYAEQNEVSHHEAASSGIDTQYGANGGYVY